MASLVIAMLKQSLRIVELAGNRLNPVNGPTCVKSAPPTYNKYLVHSFLVLSVLMHLHKNDAIMLEVNVMQEPKASALHHQEHYSIIRVHHALKHMELEKSDLNILVLIT